MSRKLLIMASPVVMSPVTRHLEREGVKYGYQTESLYYEHPRIIWDDVLLFLLDPGISLERVYLAAEARDAGVPVVLLADLYHPYTDEQWIVLSRYPRVQKYGNICLLDEVMVYIDQAVWRARCHLASVLSDDGSTWSRSILS